MRNHGIADICMEIRALQEAFLRELDKLDDQLVPYEMSQSPVPTYRDWLSNAYGDTYAGIARDTEVDAPVTEERIALMQSKLRQRVEEAAS